MIKKKTNYFFGTNLTFEGEFSNFERIAIVNGGKLYLSQNTGKAFVARINVLLFLR